MTLYYPDISAYDAGISLAGAAAACIKVTEGTGWLSSDYSPAMARARNAGVFAWAYHFLHQGNAAAQAGWCHQHAGTTPVMIDFEPYPQIGSNPALADAAVFCDELRRLGGVCTLAYVPRWYWGELGSPSLAPLATRRLAIVSSSYTTYTDDPSGPGWAPYGGMTPAIWQYTDAHSFNGHQVDFNAYRGTLAELKALVTGHPVGPPPPPPHAPAFPYAATDYLGTPRPDPHCHSGYYGGPDQANVHTWQAQMVARRWGAVTMDGCYGPECEAVCKAFQSEKTLAVDGLVGPATWAASWTAPVT